MEPVNASGHPTSDCTSRWDSRADFTSLRWIGGSKRVSARTLWNLSFEVDSQRAIARAGGLSALTTLLRGGNETHRKSAALALRKLLVNSDTDIPMDSVGGVKTLVDMVFDGDAVEKEIGAGALWKLSHKADNFSAIMESGGVLALVTLASGGNSAQKEVAARTLLGLSNAICSHDIIASAGGIPVMVALLLDESTALKELAAGVLENLAANTDYQAEIATADGISALVAMMRDGNAVPKEKAATVLWNLSRNSNSKNKMSIAAMGGIQVLVDLVRGDNDAQKEIGAAVLWNLSANEYNKAAIEVVGGIPPIVELVRSGNDAQKEKATAILWNLAFSNAANQKMIVSEGAMESLVNLVLHGTETQQENAAGVLGLVANFLDKETKIHIATEGGVNALLNFIEKPENSAWVYEGLVALMGLSGAGRGVRITMKEANAEARLSRLLDKGNKMTVELANELLEWLGCSVAELSVQCEAMGESEPLCRHVLRRLQTLLEQSDEYDLFRPIRNKFSAVLQMNGGKSMVVRLVSAHSVAESLAGLHREIDDFDGHHNLWIPQWESDRGNMKQRLFGYEIALLDRDLERTDSQAEALTMLLHEIMRNMSFYTLDELDHLKLVLRHIQSSWQRQVPALQDWFIAPHDIELVGESFAEGSFAKIYHGRFMNAAVVVKCVDINSDRDREDFLREVRVWYKASHHPNIVSLYGACHVGSPCLIVCKEMTGGTLPTYLYRQRMDGHCKPWKALLDVVHGLQYIHGQGIVHADLKGNNILMDGNCAKLTDFGMSFFQAAGQPTFPRLGAPRWRAPEFVAHGTASFKADMYSLGMCVVEAVTGRYPWGMMIPDVAVVYHLRHNTFVMRPPELSEAAWQLVCAMCDFDPSRRMELGEAEKCIRAFAKMEAVH